MWTYNDGGRAAAGYKGKTGDCVVRAIAIATGQDYKRVYNDLAALAKAKGEKTPRNGVGRKVYDPYLESLGWVWHPTMKIGQGCTTHLRADELPKGALIVRVTRHVVAVIDGVVQDTHDPARGGSRCVYGYWRKAQS